MARRGGGSAAGDITGKAIENTLTRAFIVPVLQIVFLHLVDALHEMPQTEPSILALLQFYIIVLAIWPVISTLAATAFAYAVAGPLGVILYYVVAILFSAVIGAAFTGLVILLTGFLLIFLYSSFGLDTGGGHAPRRI